MRHQPIPRPWNFHSGVHHCTTCDGLGRVASQARPSTWNPYPETTCDDCGGREGVAPCEVCGSDLHTPGYDCFACAMVDELPTYALADLDGFITALRAAATAKLLSLSDHSMKYEVNFTPPKRVVRGVHQHDIAYITEADSARDAVAYARRMIAIEAPGYKLGKVRDLEE